MPNETDIPLTFATFYTCGIKPVTNLAQKHCINLLLKGSLKSDSSDILSNSVCSNYAKGRRNLPNELRIELLNLTAEEAKDRINKINVQDFTIAANALYALVVDSSLTDNEKKRLVNCYEDKDELSFIAEVFLSCLKRDNCYPLSEAAYSALIGYIPNIFLANRTNNNSTLFERTYRINTSVSDKQADAMTNDIKNDENFDWLRNYVPESIINTPSTYVCDKVTLAQKTPTFALNFATLFQCAIKPLKSVNQREAVNALLTSPENAELSNAASSNYANGKRAVSDDYRRFLASFTEETLIKRLDSIGIFEYDRICEALLCLVKCAKIPSSQRDRLIDTYHNSGQLKFIICTFRVAADCKEAIPLSNTEMELLAEFASVKSATEPADAASTTDTESETATDKISGDALSEPKSENKYDHNWIAEYTSENTEELEKRDFFGSTVVVSQQYLHMPHDFPKLLSLLSPMFNGNPIDDFAVEEFMKLMSISKIDNNITDGSIEYMNLKGPANGIVKFISRHNLSEVSDVAFLMAGKVTNPNARDIENAIRTASNQNVNCIHAMWYDEEIPEIEVQLIMHICPEKAALQKQYTTDQYGVKIPSEHKSMG